MLRHLWGTVTAVASAAVESVRRQAGLHEPHLPDNHHPPSQLPVAPAEPSITTPPPIILHASSTRHLPLPPRRSDRQPAPSPPRYDPSMPRLISDSESSDSDDDEARPQPHVAVNRDAPRRDRSWGKDIRAPSPPAQPTSTRRRTAPPSPPAAPRGLSPTIAPPPCGHSSDADVSSHSDTDHAFCAAPSIDDLPMRGRVRRVRATPPAPRHASPYTGISWSNWVGSVPVQANAPTSLPSTIDNARDVIKDVDTSIFTDGSHLPNGPMGLAFCNHHHHISQTHLFASHEEPCAEGSSMLAEALTLEKALLNARTASARSLHITTDSKELRQLALGRDRLSSADKVGRRLADAIQRIIDLLRTFDVVYISHVRAHNRLLKENCLADLLAGLASNHRFSLDATVTIDNNSLILSRINAHRPPRNCVRIHELPALASGLSACSACKCPSHPHASCYLANAESFPVRSIFCRIQPARPPTFSEQLVNPALIDWNSAPACISFEHFTRFIAACVNNLRREAHAEASLHALATFAKMYRYLNGHISRAKAAKPRTFTTSSHPESAAKLEQLARDAKTAARLAREMHFHDAMKALDRQQPIGPLSPEAQQQLPSLYPNQFASVNIPSHAVNGRCSFDRKTIHSYVQSRSSTSSPGISGFGFNWLQLFGKLTAALEDDEHPDPNWTIFVAFIEDLACGALPWLRNWATDLKGCLFNKNPEGAAVKLRNLGIAETFVRVASYMVMQEALPTVRDLGLISEFDFGVAVPGGCEKFVKLAQVAAEMGCTVISCDLEKAFNNVLRKDLWETVRFINSPVLTAWFCFFYHDSPRVHFASDPHSPFSMSSVVSYTLHEGVAQGDPLSSLLFVATFAYILRGHREQFPQAIRTTVIDDVCLVLAPEHSHLTTTALNSFDSCLRQHNLSLNQAKTTIYCANDFGFNTSLPIPYSLSHDGFCVCRVSVGSANFCAADADAYVQKIASTEHTFERLHRALHLTETRGRGLIFLDLLRLCFRSRYSWALRTLLPTSAGRVAVAADAALMRLLNLILPRHNLPRLPDEWLHLNRIHEIKVSLPLVQGGIGLRSWHSLRHIVHFSSWIEAGPRILSFIGIIGRSLPPSISREIGESVAALSSRFEVPSRYWHMDAEKPRRKVQHELTGMLDAAEVEEASSLSHDPAVKAQFLGSSSPSMSLIFNTCLIPRYILDSLDNYSFSYALAWHVMKPLFPVFQCPCKQTWDPLGLHAAMCTKLNAYNLLHNSVRDCFAGAARSIVRDDSDANVAFILTDTHAKSATWMHHYYPLKASAPLIRNKADPTSRPSPSLSPDILISFLNDPHNPYFGDFVASSPSLANGKRHGEAAHAAHVGKLQHYFKHHTYPSRVFYPLAFERSGYMHPAFAEFIDLYARSCSTKASPQTVLQLNFSVAFAITFTTASLLKAASQLILPFSTTTLVAPRQLPMPTRWAPQLPLPRIRHHHSSASAESDAAPGPLHVNSSSLLQPTHSHDLQHMCDARAHHSSRESELPASPTVIATPSAGSSSDFSHT